MMKLFFLQSLKRELFDMLFNSFIFLIFFILILPIDHLLKKKNVTRNVFLLVTSYFFYGFWDWRFTFLLLISTLIDFFIAQKIYTTLNKNKKKIYLTISLISNLGILGFFKYFNFFTESFSEMLSLWGYKPDFIHLNIILPVGISFYTFQTLSYTLDIYNNKLKPTKSLINFALFVAFFPQLVAGPIERAKNLLPQIENRKKIDKYALHEAIYLITSGYFKKVLIGDTSGKFVDRIFAYPQYYSSYELLMGTILFSIQIYADFSGYSEIARGVAKLLGIDLKINFKQPYLSTNITEFWRKWHISLSSWLKDYLYIPLGGNKKGKNRTSINLFITMLIGGLWHGANWTFIIWGAVHGFYLLIHKKIKKGKKIGTQTLIIKIIKILITYILVLFSWLFFRAESFDSAIMIIKKIFTFEGILYTKIIIITSTYLFFSFFLDILEKKEMNLKLLNKARPFRWGVYAAIWTMVLLYMYQGKPSPFVYFQF